MTWLISVGDAVSQLLGRLIPVRVDDRWTCWTLSANESISGAAHRHAEAGRFAWVEPAIDWLLSWMEPDHCRASYEADLARAIEVITDAGIPIGARLTGYHYSEGVQHDTGF